MLTHPTLDQLQQLGLERQHVVTDRSFHRQGGAEGGVRTRENLTVSLATPITASSQTT